MEQQTKLIAERLKWARINADVSPEALASACGITVEEYLELEKEYDGICFAYDGMEIIM